MTDEAMTYQSLSSQLRSMSSSNNKHCWVCFASEDDDFAAQWVSPCKCKGTAKWVHKACLQRWIDEKQQGNSTVEVACPQCNSVYVIIYPKSGLFVRVLDVIDRIICKSCPFLAGGILVGSVYWTAVTYGAVTIMQVLGHKEGLNVMEKADPLIMLIGLPAIPVMLMLGRLIRWEDAVLKFWRKHSTKLPLINMIFPNSSSQYLPRTPAVAYSSNSDPVSFTRTICGGLILPTIATIVGKLLFQRVNSNFQRSIIGGMAYICLKGILKIYYKQQQFLRQAHRQIKNYEPPAQSAAAAGASMTTASIQHHHHIQPTSSSSFLHAASSHNPQQLSSSTSSTASQSAPSFLTNSSTAFNHSNIFVNSQQPQQQNSSNPHSESSARSHDLMNNNEESTLNHYLLYETTSGSRASTSSSSHLDTETNSSDAQTSSSHHNEHF